MTEGRGQDKEAVRMTPRPLQMILALPSINKPIARLVLQTLSGA